MTETTTPTQTNATPPADPGQAQRNRRKNRWTLAALLLVFLSPTLFALFWRPDGRVNFGELIAPPKPLVSAALLDRDGSASSTDEIRKKWVWLTVTRGSCAEVCQQNLYNMRQARIAEGKYTKRIRYAVLVLDPAEGSAAAMKEAGFQAEHPVLDYFSASGDDAANLARLFESAADAKLDDQIFIVDPLGNIMMRYPKRTEGKPMKNDLSRLLRASHVG